VANKARQKVGRVGFHCDATARTHEAILGSRVGNANGSGQFHGHANANGGAIERCDGGFAASVNGKVQATTTDQELAFSQEPQAAGLASPISVILQTLVVTGTGEPNVEISTSTE
jgi:hypothetical protein